MYEVIFLIVLGIIAILFATIQDLKKREVANWLNFSLIIFALGFRFFYSLFEASSFDFFYQGLIGLFIFFVLGNLLYYGRVFAGGDAKLMIALGTILPFGISFWDNLNIFFLFILLFLIAGAIYGLFWSFVLMTRNFKKFRKEFNLRFKQSRKLVCLGIIFAILFLVLSFFEFDLIYISIIVFVLPYFYLAAKSIDEVCMVKNVDVKNLTEGDWLYKDLKIGKQKIKANWDGLTKEDIELIKKHKKKVVIRQGIPFTPAFLISFVALVILWFNGIKDVFIFGF